MNWHTFIHKVKCCPKEEQICLTVPLMYRMHTCILNGVTMCAHGLLCEDILSEKEGKKSLKVYSPISWVGLWVSSHLWPRLSVNGSKVNTDQYTAPLLCDTLSLGKDNKPPHSTLREESYCTSGILCHSSANEYGTISMPSGPMRTKIDSSGISVTWLGVFGKPSHHCSFMSRAAMSLLYALLPGAP